MRLTAAAERSAGSSTAKAVAVGQAAGMLSFNETATAIGKALENFDADGTGASKVLVNLK